MSTDINGTLNRGFHALNWTTDSPLPSTSTALVIGQARSGTSLVMLLLQGMGVYCGDTPDPVTLEDARLASALATHKRRWTAPQAVVEDYNLHHARWAFKHPAHNLRVLDKAGSFRTPRLVYISRDPVAVCVRALQYRPGEAFADLFNRNLWLNYRRMRALLRSEQPALFISYEKLITQPRPIIETLARFVGVTLAPETMDRLVALIAPSDPGYSAKWATNATLKGYMDLVDRTQVNGWLSDGTASPTRAVTLFINDEFVAAMPANHLRKDVLKIQAHPTGHCGFRFRLDLLDVASRFGPQTEWRIQVRDAATGMELRNSPRALPAEPVDAAAEAAPGPSV